jgi:hypothetical protein
MIRRCIGCATEITACMGFGLARDIVAERYPVRELCGRCADRCVGNPALFDLLTEEDTPWSC